MKKALFIVALVALMVPTTFGRDYLHVNGDVVGQDDTGGNIYQNPNVDWEKDDGRYEMKAENYNWPVQYQFLDAATIPVRMSVGYWIKFDTKDKKIIVNQIEIHKYAGETTVPVSTNVDIQLKAYFTKATSVSNVDMAVESLTLNTVEMIDSTGAYKCAAYAEVKANTGSTDVKIYLKIKDVNLQKFTTSQVGTCIDIGTVTLQVRPKVTPQIKGSC